jgi:adenylate kinase
MRKVILIAGVAGVGKSTMAQNLKKKSMVIHLDRFQSCFVKRNISEGIVCPWDWKYFKFPTIQNNLTKIILETLESDYLRLKKKHKSIIVEGSALILDSFTEKFLEGLSIFLEDDSLEISWFLLDLDIENVINQRKRRMNQLDIEEISDVEKLKIRQKFYRTRSKASWQIFKNQLDLEQSIKSTIAN